MLNLDQKINYMKNYLEIKNHNYGDNMKEEIYFHFFENGADLHFLNNLIDKHEIEKKIEFLVSKMILNEDYDGFSNIISNYI